MYAYMVLKMEIDVSKKYGYISQLWFPVCRATPKKKQHKKLK